MCSSLPLELIARGLVSLLRMLVGWSVMLWGFLLYVVDIRWYANRVLSLPSSIALCCRPHTLHPDRHAL